VKEIVVALSGTLETFSLPDVLRLLSTTKKTGLLALDGDRGRGRIWVRDGDIVAADADRAVNEQMEGVAFELLRFGDATFEFESGAEAPAEGDAREVEAVLAEAESRLAEWREIEAVVPSLDVWVRMVSDIGADRTVSPTQWRMLAQVGTGTSGHQLADRLSHGEYDVCRQLRDLVQDGLVELEEAPVVEPAPVDPAPVFGVDVDAAWETPIEPTFVEPDLEPEDVSALGADLASFVADGTVPEPVPADDGELLSELSQLSPKAAAAVEATWGEEGPAAEVDEEPAPVEAPTPEAEAAPAGDDIDQNLLLRFLSSAKG
jgi:hypothetical protein